MVSRRPCLSTAPAFMMVHPLLLLALAPLAWGQTFQRLGACPDLGCILPPDQYVSGVSTPTVLTPPRSDFLPGQYFDVRVEVHAPVNGSQATGKTQPDTRFSLAISKVGGSTQQAAAYFGVNEPRLETWNFTWYEGGIAICLSSLECALIGSRSLCAKGQDALQSQCCQ